MNPTEYFVVLITGNVVVTLSDTFSNYKDAMESWERLIKVHRGQDVRICQTIYG